MRLLIQRVLSANVIAEKKVIGEIGSGLLLFVGIGEEDSGEDIEWLVTKVSQLRIFNDADQKMNSSISDTGGAFLVISQFTLGADTSRGNRPGFSGTAPPEEGERLYKHFRHTLSEFGIATQIGIYGKTMRVDLTNEGPVTIWLDTQKH